MPEDRREAIHRNPVDRYWLLTWTTYGSWLPGDKRGFTGWTFSEDGEKVTHNTPGSPMAPPNQQRREQARRQMTSESILLEQRHAEICLAQFRETAQHRGWLLSAAAIMRNHVHLLLGVSGDPDPEKLLGDCKSWATRKLNAAFEPRPKWWTRSGSKRRLPDLNSVSGAIEYIRRQHDPLVVWIRGEDGSS